MTAINAETWDIFATKLLNFSHTIAEDYADRPWILDQLSFSERAYELKKYADENILPFLQDDAVRQHVDALFQNIQDVGKENIPAFTKAEKHIKEIFDTIPELAGRHESYSERFMRRRDLIQYTLPFTPNLREVFDRHAKGECAFFFDLDGSLISAIPGQQTGYDADLRLQHVLNRLNAQTKSAMSVVTGRPDIFLEQVFPHGGFFTASEHGVIVRNHVDGEILRTYTGDIDIDHLSNEVQQEMVRQGLNPEECYVEEFKSGSLTVQFTESADPKAAAKIIKEILNRAVASPTNVGSKMPLMLVDGNVPGNRVMDLVPETADKGKTLAWMYQTYPEIFAGKVPVMVGDSGGDETAMKFAIEQGGYAIGVGEKAPKISNIRLRSLNQMRDVLTTMVEDTMNTQKPKRSAAPYEFVI